jgi:hypothetical protein
MLRYFLRCASYHDGPLPDCPFRHKFCRDIGIVGRESLSDRLVDGLEDEGGAVDRVGERAGQEKLAVVGSRAGQLQVGVAVGGAPFGGTGPRRRRAAGSTRFLRESGRAQLLSSAGAPVAAASTFSIASGASGDRHGCHGSAPSISTQGAGGDAVAAPYSNAELAALRSMLISAGFQDHSTMLRNTWPSSAGWLRVTAHSLVSQHRGAVWMTRR